MTRRRERANVDWETPAPNTWDGVQVELLMDIRSELRTLNALLGCTNFTQIPRTLRTIRAHTSRLPPKPRRA